MELIFFILVCLALYWLTPLRKLVHEVSDILGLVQFTFMTWSCMSDEDRAHYNNKPANLFQALHAELEKQDAENNQN